MRGRGERDEGEGEVAFEGVGDADDAAFGDEGGGGDGLFDCACVSVSFFSSSSVISSLSSLIQTPSPAISPRRDDNDKMKTTYLC